MFVFCANEHVIKKGNYSIYVGIKASKRRVKWVYLDFDACGL